MVRFFLKPNCYKEYLSDMRSALVVLLFVQLAYLQAKETQNIQTQYKFIKWCSVLLIKFMDSPCIGVPCFSLVGS